MHLDFEKVKLPGTIDPAMPEDSFHQRLTLSKDIARTYLVKSEGAVTALDEEEHLRPTCGSWRRGSKMPWPPTVRRRGHAMPPGQGYACRMSMGLLMRPETRQWRADVEREARVAGVDVRASLRWQGSIGSGVTVAMSARSHCLVIKPLTRSRTGNATGGVHSKGRVEGH